MIVRDGLRRMCTEQEDVFYYLTVMNENYVQPPLPEGVEDGILRGLYRVREGSGTGARVQLLGSGAILREVLAAAELLERDFEVAADVWSVTSFTELRRDGIEAERWKRLHPTEDAAPRRTSRRRSPRRRARSSRRPTTCAPSPTRSGSGCRGSYTALGTDGFGRSDYRVALRRFFEVDRHHVAVAALEALARRGRGRAVGRAGGDRALRARSPTPRRRGRDEREPSHAARAIQCAPRG